MLRVWALCLVALLTSAPAEAAVTITFYSHDFRMFGAGMLANFPHGFVALSGTPDDGTPAVTSTFGFSATDFFINALWEPVEGSLDPSPLPASYMASADRHFSFPLTDAQYHAVTAVVDKWKNWPQPSPMKQPARTSGRSRSRLGRPSSLQDLGCLPRRHLPRQRQRGERFGA